MGCTNTKKAVPQPEFTLSRVKEDDVEINIIPAEPDVAVLKKSLQRTNSGTQSVEAASTIAMNGSAITQSSQIPSVPRVAVPRPKDSSAALSKADTVIARTDFKETYTLGRKIGEGNYAVVHAATDNVTKQEVAVKIMEREGLNESDVRDIKEEVSILMELDHPNIIKVFDFFEDEEFFYIVTELMGGGELFDEILEREFYWERDAQEVVKMLADALDYLHRRGIVHRDLKPENVLLTSKGKDGIVKLADFGFAARTDTRSNAFPLSTPCGTPAYVAPEIISYKNYGKEVDMWSLGVIAFILLAGYPPFHDKVQDKLFHLIRRGEFTFNPEYWSLVSPEAKDCVNRLLTVDRSKRMTAEEVKRHPWIMSVPETAEEGNTFGGVGGRGAGLDGRGPSGSVNLAAALKELRQFQARQRWKDGMALALAREGQVFGSLTSIASLSDTPPAPQRAGDITQLPGLGSSKKLDKWQTEKRQRGAFRSTHQF